MHEKRISIMLLLIFFVFSCFSYVNSEKLDLQFPKIILVTNIGFSAMETAEVGFSRNLVFGFGIEKPIKLFRRIQYIIMKYEIYSVEEAADQSFTWYPKDLRTMLKCHSIKSGIRIPILIWNPIAIQLEFGLSFDYCITGFNNEHMKTFYDLIINPHISIGLLNYAILSWISLNLSLAYDSITISHTYPEYGGDFHMHSEGLRINFGIHINL
ncbi:MAG: hypothetical protein J7L77_03875 [Clostridiales bacterium]|nr:hypothetical protein [Clostridiales bacterium]